MYPPKDRDEQKAKLSTENARDIADAIDELVTLRIYFELTLQRGDEPTQEQRDNIEMLKRRITDYLIVTDPRPGVYVDK